MGKNPGIPAGSMGGADGQQVFLAVSCRMGVLAALGEVLLSCGWAGQFHFQELAHRHIGKVENNTHIKL